METNELASSLRSVISALHKGLRKQVYSAKTFSLTEIETIAQLVRHNTLLPTELAALTKVKTQSMSQILKKLEAEGIIKRTPSKEDKRKVFISLTNVGKKLIEKTINEKDVWLKGLIKKTLSDKEKEMLAKAVPLLNKLIENN